MRHEGGEQLVKELAALMQPLTRFMYHGMMTSFSDP